MGKRRAQYEEALSTDPLDYDTWFDYARLEEAQVSDWLIGLLLLLLVVELGFGVVDSSS